MIDITVKICIFVLCIISKANGNDKQENNTTTTYNPEELLAKIFNPTQARQGGYGLIKFDDQSSVKQSPGQFTDPSHPYREDKKVSFQDDNQIVGQKKRRRRRKPKNQGYGFGVVPPGLYGGQDPNQQYPGAGMIPQGYPSPGLNPYHSPGYPQNQFYRPPRRPRPSFTTEALSSIIQALTSIALYDDYQCVPRLLCEASSGGTLGSAGLLQSAAGLQPLLTLLAAYNGISSSPLFVFGRAVFLGMTSKSNPGTCRYAYPQCPNDPEQLVHYLNNHNGGFFRFFNAPPQQQNLQQFYHQLSLPNPGQNYGLVNNQGQNEAQSYGLYQNQLLQQMVNQQSQYGFYNPNQYGNQQYGNRYPYQNGEYQRYNKANVKNKLEKRIQNHPNNVDAQETFSFPNDNSDDDFRENYLIGSNRGGKGLRFPENSIRNDIDHLDDHKNGGRLTFPNRHEVPLEQIKPNPFFPESNSNRQYVNYYNYPPLVNYNDFRRDRGLNNIKDGVELVYVVRGNGDPNNPEVIKLRPGQKVV